MPGETDGRAVTSVDVDSTGHQSLRHQLFTWMHHIRSAGVTEISCKRFSCTTDVAELVVGWEIRQRHPLDNGAERIWPYRIMIQSEPRILRQIAEAILEELGPE